MSAPVVLAPTPRVLSLHRWMDTDLGWSAKTTSIRRYDPDYYAHSFFQRSLIATEVARDFDVCVFEDDPRFAFVAGIAMRARHALRLCMVGTYPLIVSKGGIGLNRTLRPGLLYWFLYHLIDRVIVHSTGEIAEYARFFRVPESRFRFVPYFIPYTPRDGLPPDWDERWSKGNILCAGRHRDLGTFAHAIERLNRRAVILAGRDDIAQLANRARDGLEIHVELGKDAFYRFFDNAALIVLPFFRERMLRSLGHIVFLEAACRGIPVITSRTFHLADYFREGEHALCFEPENPGDLREKIEWALTEHEGARVIADCALSWVKSNFTRARYAERLWQEIAS